MRLNSPKGYELFAGVEPSYQPGADGWHWFAQWCKGPEGGGMYVFRQENETAVAKPVPYGPLMPGRGMFSLGGNGVLYVTGSDKGNAPLVYTVPGFSRFTSAGPKVQTIPVVTPVIDEDARAMASRAATDAAKASEKADRANDRLDNLKPVEPVSDAHIADIAWTKAHDAIFASAHDGFLSSWTWQKALDAAFLFCKQRGLVV
jgi:hypothetical protein